MELLNKKKVRVDEQDNHLETLRRINSMKDEEFIIAKKLNNAKNNDKSERERIFNEFGEFKSDIKIKKDSLLREVGKLESRREDALKPIHEIHKEAETRLKEVIKKENDVEKSRIDVKEIRDNIIEEIQNLKDLKDDHEEKNAEINAKKIKIVSEEERIKKSTNRLSSEWLEFNTKVADSNRVLIKRETEISAKVKGNEGLLQIIEEGRKEVSNGRKEIKDGYENLEKARLEILENKIKPCLRLKKTTVE